MTNEEAIEKLQDILDEATAYEHAVCYVTNVDKEPLTMAIEALKTEAIPVEWLKSRMITAGEVANGDYFEDEALELNMYVSDLIGRWQAEQRNEE